MNPIAMHDQALTYIQNDALFTEIDGGISFEILAQRFEHYWRQRIARELDFLEEPANRGPDYHAACAYTKTAAIAIAAKGIPGGII
jgi:hypothetical protein